MLSRYQHNLTYVGTLCVAMWTKIAPTVFQRELQNMLQSTGNVSSKINQTLGLVRFVQHYVACVCVCVPTPDLCRYKVTSTNMSTYVH